MGLTTSTDDIYHRLAHGMEHSANSRYHHHSLSCILEHGKGVLINCHGCHPTYKRCTWPMGQCFNAPIDSIRWPSTLTSLILSDAFNHPLECVRLPDSITYLHLGQSYDHPIESMHLPAALTELNMGSLIRFNHPLEQIRMFNEARESLVHLRLPSVLHTLRLGGKMEGKDLAALAFPHSLTSLDLGPGCDASLDDIQWPPHLTRLSLSHRFNQPLLNWSPPSSLAELTLGDKDGYGGWNYPVSQLRLPSNLRKLTFG